MGKLCVFIGKFGRFNKMGGVNGQPPGGWTFGLSGLLLMLILFYDPWEGGSSSHDLRSRGEVGSSNTVAWRGYVMADPSGINFRASRDGARRRLVRERLPQIFGFSIFNANFLPTSVRRI
jgi:hypothetical protein